MIKIANFVLDEKFIDGQIEFQDLTSDVCQHDYYFVGNKPYKYIKKQTERVRRLAVSEVLRVVKDYDAVFLHSIYGMPFDLIPRIDNRVKVFWFSWGYDIYNTPSPTPLVKLELYHPATRRYINHDLKGLLLNKLMHIREIIKKRGNKFYYEAIKRADYFSGIIPEEYGLVKHYYPDFKALPTSYSYCNVSQFPLFDKVDPNIIQGKNIIIGNSTAYTNNHLDIFEALSNLNLGTREIIAPLSYSPNPRYVKVLKEKGKILFGDYFKALIDFLPLDEYNKILKSCGFCIYGIERQQALGNIINSLFFGCKVFLYKSSILYKHYKSMGVKVFSIEDDLTSNKAFEPLSYEDAFLNKTIIGNSMKKEVVLQKLYDIYNII